MIKERKIWMRLQKIANPIVGYILVLGIMVTLLVYNMLGSNQSMPASYLDVYFEGEYRIGDGEWQKIIEGKHISATKGDVFLKGTFHTKIPNGEYIGPAQKDMMLAFYMNHVSITIYEEHEPYMLDLENEVLGEGLCGINIFGYTLRTTGPVTIQIHNPHKFGNENAVDDFLKEISFYAGSQFENDFAEKGEMDRMIGLIFLVIGFVLLGSAVFSGLLHSSYSAIMWMIGFMILFAGGYFILSSKGVFFVFHSIIGSTTLLGICMMLYMLLVSGFAVTFLKSNIRNISKTAVIVLGFFCAGAAVLSMVTNVYFYDIWCWWAILQSLVNGVILFCYGWEFFVISAKRKFEYFGIASILVAFWVDFVATYYGWWQGGKISKYVFVILLIMVLLLAWRVIPKGITAATKAKQLEAEQKELKAQLQEKRMAIMISQIQPHFIYNTLGTIKQLCLDAPEQAAQLAHDFSRYLRGNFSELNNTMPIRFTQELEHVRCYTDIEQVRFPDMMMLYNIQTEDFVLPALSVQPLVENAIKHGLMGLEQGGTVTITSYETATYYCVEVLDDGVGFDVEEFRDTTKHIGIQNVTERLKTMCDGRLIIKSQPGKGTLAQIRIPKEGKEQ